MYIIDTIINILNVLPQNIKNLNLTVLINAVVIYGFFYFISRWFKAYILRLLLFLIGLHFVLNACNTSYILFNVDFYGGLGLLTPHIEIVELTYLIIKEKILFIYDQIVALILLIIKPFLFIYKLIYKFIVFFKEKKRKNHDNQKQEKQKDNFKQQKNYYKEENNYKHEYKSNKNYKKEKTVSRWDSNDPYEVLGIDKTATKQEIKKAYRNLSKIYHPDLTLTKKEEYTKIFQKINWAYQQLKK